MDQNEHKLIPIPLPTEIPDPPPLDKLPLDVVHSATVEMLIQQNEDLSARLKVNIRRNSVQEQEILKLKKELSDIQRSNDNLRAQNEIVQEKQSIWQAQKEAKNRQLETITEEQKLLELRYNELYTTSQYRHKELQDQLIAKSNLVQQTEKNRKDAIHELHKITQRQKESLEKKLHTAKVIKERGKDKFREFLLKAGEATYGERLAKHKAQGEHNLMRKQLAEVKDRFAKREKFLKDKIFELSELSKTHIRNLEKRLKECEKEIQIRDQKMANIESIHQDNMAQEMELERERRRELEVKVEELKSHIAKEGNSRAQVEKLSEEISSIQNKKIEDLRASESEKEELIIESNRLREMNQRLRNDNSSMSLQFHEHKRILESCEKKLLEVSRDNEHLEKELDSLKTLWMDIQEKYEKELVKVQSLTKLNRQLSENIFDKKVTRSIDQSTRQSAETPPEKPQEKVSEKTDHLDKKISEIYASQFSSMDRDSTLDG